MIPALDEAAALVVGFIAGVGTGVLAIVMVAERVARASVASAKVAMLARRTKPREKVKAVR